MTPTRALGPIVVLGLSCSACPGELIDPARFVRGPGPTGCELIVANVLSSAQSCAASGCHARTNPAAGLDLASPNLFARLSDAPASSVCDARLLIDPDAPAQSLIFLKLGATPPCGRQMPLGNELPAEDVACVLTWLSTQQRPPDDAGVADTGVIPDSGVEVRDGGGPPDAGDVRRLYVEAESGVLTSPMAVLTDGTASGGQYVSTPANVPLQLETPPGADGIASISFPVGVPGVFRFWGRVIGPDIDSNSFWVRLDGGNWFRWNNIPTGRPAWAWDDIHDSENNEAPLQVMLESGMHTLEVGHREPRARLDQILITKDLDFQPMN